MEEIRTILSKATDPEKMSFVQILGGATGTEGIMEGLQRAATSSLGYRLGSRPSYHDIVTRIASRMNISASGLTTEQIERRIVALLWNTVWEKMTPEQRSAFDEKLREECRDHKKATIAAGATITGATLLAAQVSGFGVYLLASSTLAAITSGLGLTLPFAAYTAMSTVISTIIGPVGWLGLGLLCLYKLTGPDNAKTTRAIVMMHCVRTRLKTEEEELRRQAERRRQEELRRQTELRRQEELRRQRRVAIASVLVFAAILLAFLGYLHLPASLP